MMLNKTKLGMAVLTALLLTTGCEQKQTAEQHLTAAKAYVTEAENSKAIIELKNALSKEQNLDEARLLLGQLYLKNGEFLAAEIEFNKLYNSDYPPSKLLVDLAKARYLQQEFDTIPDLWQQQKNLSSTQIAQLGFYTYISAKRAENTEKLNAVKQALIPAKEEQTYTKLIIAYEQAEQQKIDQALATVNNILLAEPRNIDALLFKSQLHSVKKEYGEAVTALEQFLQEMPNYILAELYLADALFNDKQFSQAEPHINKLIEAAPDFGYTNYLKGMLLFTQNQFEESKLHLEKAIQTKTNIQQSKLYAGLSAYRTENYEQAYEYLNDVIELVPNNDELRRLLSVVQFKLGYNIEASDSIAKLNELSEQDLNLANEASFSYLKAGQTDKAKKLVEQASKVESNNALELAKLGMLKVSLQDMSGIVDIKKAIELDSSVEQAKVALVQAYLGQGLADDALEVAEQWIHDEPDNINGYNLAGFVAARKGDMALAEKYLVKALEIDQGNVSSLMFLAGKANKNNQIEKATELLAQLIDNKPDYIPALVNNYLLSKRLGKVENALSLLALALEKSPNNALLQQVYLRALYTEKMFDKASALIEKKGFSSSTEEIFWMIAINIYLNNEDYEKAHKLAVEWTKLHPNSEKAWATAIQTSDNDKPLEIIELFKSAVRVFPNSEQLRLTLAQQYVNTRQLSLAKVELTKLSQDNPNVAYLNLVIALHDRRFDEIVEAYKVRPVSIEGEAVLHVKSYKGINERSHANQLVNKYLDLFPQSAALLFEKATLKEFYSVSEQKRLYQQILALTPDNPYALNNLANIHIRAGEVDEGLLLSHKAFQLAPNVLPIIDSYASALVANKYHEQAASIYRGLFSQTKETKYFKKLASNLQLSDQQTLLRELLEKYKRDLPETVKKELAQELK